MHRTRLTILILMAASWICASGQKKGENAGANPTGPKLTEEEIEIIRNRELLENLELLENFDSVHYLRLLAQDGTARTKRPPALQKGAGQNAKRKKDP